MIEIVRGALTLDMPLRITRTAKAQVRCLLPDVVDQIHRMGVIEHRAPLLRDIAAKGKDVLDAKAFVERNLPGNGLPG